MSGTHASLAPGVVVETVGEEVLVYSPGTTDVVVLSGQAAMTVRAITCGQPVDSSDSAFYDLVDRGIIARTSGFSRRGLLKAGAIGTGAGIAVISMPSVAAASSDNGAAIVSRGWFGPDQNSNFGFELHREDNPDTFPPAGSLPNDLNVQISVVGQALSFQATFVRADFIFFTGLQPSPAFSGTLTGNMTIDGVEYSVTIPPQIP